MVVKLAKKRWTNKEWAKQEEGFIQTCQRMGTKPTTRQASKWRNGKGLAWKNRIRGCLIQSDLISPKKDG